MHRHCIVWPQTIEQDMHTMFNSIAPASQISYTRQLRPAKWCHYYIINKGTKIGYDLMPGLCACQATLTIYALQHTPHHTCKFPIDLLWIIIPEHHNADAPYVHHRLLTWLTTCHFLKYTIVNRLADWQWLAYWYPAGQVLSCKTPRLVPGSSPKATCRKHAAQ